MYYNVFFVKKQYEFVTLFTLYVKYVIFYVVLKNAEIKSNQIKGLFASKSMGFNDL